MNIESRQLIEALKEDGDNRREAEDWGAAKGFYGKALEEVHSSSHSTSLAFASGGSFSTLQSIPMTRGETRKALTSSSTSKSSG